MTQQGPTSPRFSRAVEFIPDAMAVVYDLDSFTKFANQPDAARFVPDLLNEVSNGISTLIDGGDAYWDNIKWGPIKGLLQRKFLGDGELLLFQNTPDISEKHITSLLNRFYNLSDGYGKVKARISEKVPLPFLPPGLRFGIARGSLLKLHNTTDDESEYIGVCINLASRLQSYCRELQFVASSRVVLSSTMLKKHEYRRIVARDVRGFGKEDVIVDVKSFGTLSAVAKKRLFVE